LGAGAAFKSAPVTRQSLFLANRMMNALGLSTNSLRVILLTWFSSIAEIGISRPDI
jgi:hypothetical protein